jgi:hypothetical protein
MPEEIESKLKEEARKKGMKPGTKAYGRYVYGAMNNMDLMRGNKPTGRTKPLRIGLRERR